MKIESKFFCISLLLYLREMIDVQYTYCDHHFVMYVSQIIILYTTAYAVLYVNSI